jgi:hypothetical protein
MRLPKRVSNYAWCKRFEQKKCICKDKCSSVCCNCGGVRACLGRAEPVLICSYQKYPSAKYCTMVYLSNNDSSRRGSYTLTVRYFSKEILVRTANDDLTATLISSGEANFNIKITVNLYRTRVWATENPHVTIDQKRDSPKVNVFFFLPFRRWPFMAPAPSWGEKKPVLATLTPICLSYGFCPT